MKRFYRLVSVFALLISVFVMVIGCNGGAQKLAHFDYSEGDGTEVNRTLFYKNISDIDEIGDPSTVYLEDEEGACFYTVGTWGNYFRLWKSRNLTDWEDIGIIFHNTPEFFGVESFWAPQLFWDEEADWQYYLGEDAGEGKGLWCLFFSARVSFDEINSWGEQTCQLAVAFSKTIDGEYELFEGVNANGDYMDAGSYLFDIEKIKDIDFSEWENAHEAFGPIYKNGRSFIDACPFIDPVTGDKYMYFCCNRYAGDMSNDIWGVKMKDWVTCDYPTVRPLTSEGYVNPDQKQKWDMQTPSGSIRIDEGPFMHYEDFTDDGVDNGTYYLTLSNLARGFHFYTPVQALSTSPLGEYNKVMAADGGLVISSEQDWDIEATGHHDFFYVGDEIWMSYHSYISKGGVIGTARTWKCDRVKFVENSKGQMIMRANGPSVTVQPLPELVSGYKNMAESATVTVNGGNDKSLLNDGYLAITQNRIVDEFITDKSETKITLKWDDYFTARAIMVYNSYDYDRIFKNVEKIEFSVRKTKDGKTSYGKAVINDLGFSVEHNRVPLLYTYGESELTEEEIEEFTMMYPCVSAVAEFDEIEINKVTITIKKAKGKSAVGISEIVVLGKEA